MAKKIKLVVELPVPDDVTHGEVKRYVEGEIKAGTGGMHPDDPLFGAFKRGVKVSSTDKYDAAAKALKNLLELYELISFLCLHTEEGVEVIAAKKALKALGIEHD